ncbi:glutathione S-transferase family protein [Herbaspirillum aquaticum]|uniref:Glutathione S-transferase n=1 Tax=Herbaspirillum aquaticum TaxID=568783 RepID=A0A225SV51_9BURK|nr:glutathione S-transferase [Herbaspirillum aquaticum]OWY34536.1 glutathione S-transferase [Herbaspirillum aquaticum]
MKIHHFSLSGHAHRAVLFASLLGLEAELVHVDLAGGAHKQPAFLALNPFGQVPVLEDGEVVIADSNAILVYLAKKAGRTDWLPEDAKGAAAVQRWLSVAAGELAYGPAAARLITVFGARFNPEEVIQRAHLLLGRMEQHLATRQWLAADHPTIADVAVYSYLAGAPEGNVDLSAYPAVLGLLERIEALPGFVPFPRTAAGLRATQA